MQTEQKFIEYLLYANMILGPVKIQNKYNI